MLACQSFKISVLVLIASLLFAHFSWAAAHSSDNHGPHDGIVRDNELITVEVVQGASNELMIYVMDAKRVPLTLKPAQLRATLAQERKGASAEHILNCSAQRLEGFKCLLPPESKLSPGDVLNVLAMPDSMEKSTLTFNFPFSLSADNR